MNKKPTKMDEGEKLYHSSEQIRNQPTTGKKLALEMFLVSKSNSSESRRIVQT